MAGVLWLAGVVAACKKAPPPAPPIAMVRVTKVQSRNVPLTKEWLATIDGSTTAQIQPQVTGYIREVNYREGSVVGAGQLMFTLDERPFRAAVAKAQGDHANAVAQLEKAKSDVRRYTPLVKERAISREQLDNARAAVLAGQGSVQASKGALQTAKLNLEWAKVRAPISGLTGLARARVGTLVNPNQVLTVVSTLDPMRASFNLSQQDYLQYADALKNPNAPQYADRRYFELTLIDGRVYPHRAHNIIVNREIEPSTGTLQVQALFPNPDGLLRPGLFAKVRVHVGEDRAVAVVPERAVSELQGQYQVAIVDNQQRIQLRKIELGQPIGHEYVVENGLHPGEQVVVEGQQRARPGSKVNVQQAPPVRPDGGPPHPSSDGGARPDVGRGSEVGARSESPAPEGVPLDGVRPGPGAMPAPPAPAPPAPATPPAPGSPPGGGPPPAQTAAPDGGLRPSGGGNR